MNSNPLTSIQTENKLKKPKKTTTNQKTLKFLLWVISYSAVIKRWAAGEGEGAHSARTGNTNVSHQEYSPRERLFS